MPRPKLVDRPRRMELSLPESIAGLVDLELFSELEGKVPYGRWSELVTTLLKEWLTSRGVHY